MQEPFDLDAVRTTADYTEERSEATPDEIAVFDNAGGNRTWEELADDAAALAKGLLEYVEPGAVVFEQLQNCVELFVLRLAAELAGVRLLTAPRQFRRAEIEAVFRRLAPELAIVPGTYRGFDYAHLVDEVDPGSVRQVVSLDGSTGMAFAELHTVPNSHGFPSRHGPEDICQLTLTSGTSGTPSCVAVPIAARIRTALVHGRRFAIGPDDVIGVVTSFVNGNPDSIGYHGAPQIGATVALLDRLDVVTLADWIGQGVSVLPAVPTVTAKLVEYAEKDDRNLSLSVIVNYGDELSVSLGRTAESRFDCTIHQAFGATEYGGICATDQADDQTARLSTVGRPLVGNEVAILVDGQVELPPSNAIGTLLVRGRHAAGECLTEPVETVAGYTKIDVRAQFDDAGRIVLLGREKDLIIRGGRNIYPGEIEDLIESHPDIAQAAVIGIPSETLGELVCAYAVPIDGASTTAPGLSAWLEERNLATFKRPERVVFVDGLPMSPAGTKVDKEALKRRFEAEIQVEGDP